MVAFVRQKLILALALGTPSLSLADQLNGRNPAGDKGLVLPLVPRKVLGGQVGLNDILER